MDKEIVTLPDLTNPEFTYVFDGKEYVIRKASLRDIASYEKRVKELSAKGELNNSDILAYCLYLILRKGDNSITEDYVAETSKGDIDYLMVLEQLGFMNLERVKTTREIQARIVEAATKVAGSSSSVQSSTELAGQ